MKRARLLFLAMLFGASCSTPLTEETTATQNEGATTQITPALQGATPEPAGDDFDWSSAPRSTAAIGDFPYVKMPATFMVLDANGERNSKTRFTQSQDFGKLLMYDGRHFFPAVGVLAKLHYGTREVHSEWRQTEFADAVQKYFAGIGAKQIFAGQLPAGATDSLMKTEGPALAGYLLADDYFETPVSHYALNNASQKVFFQVHHNDAWGEIWVLPQAVK